jgi:peptidoglycan/xylan/chitin deacetylase (PgdA/CDA1 family)
MRFSVDRVLRQAWSLRREAVGAAVYWSGLAHCYEAAARPDGAIVLMYHSVTPDGAARFVDPPNRISPVLFERQMAFLSRRRCVVSLSELVEQVAIGRSPSAGTVAITLDDGYLDTLNVVAPILARYRLPATVFLATGYIERGESQWADVVHWCFECRTAGTPRGGTWAGERIDLESESGRLATRKVVHRRLLEAGYEERRQLLAELLSKLRPGGQPPRLSLNWDDVRELCRRYPSMEIGGHTRNHVDLRTHRDASARLEISGCAEDLRRELRIEPRHFSFPYGRWCAETREMVAGSGWWSAAGDGGSVRVRAASDRFLLPRTDAPRTMSELRFKTSGAYPGVFSLLGLR